MSEVPSQETERLAAYQERGWIVLRGVFTQDEIGAWLTECERLLSLSLVHPDNLRTRFRPALDAGPVCERFDPVVDVSPVFSAVAQDERLLGPIASLLADRPLLFKDKLIFKPPGMTGYQMHQDGSWWPGFPFPEMLSALIAFDAARLDNGALEVFSGYQHELLSTPGETRNMTGLEMRRIDLKAGTLLEAEPGDVIVFHALTPHRSGANTSSRWRRQLYLTYSPARHGDLWAAHREHIQAYVQASLDPAAQERLYFE
jgi:hypothetical protein